MSARHLKRKCCRENSFVYLLFKTEKNKAKKTCKYPVINGPKVEKCITFSRVYKFASCLKSDQQKATKSSPHIFREVISLYVAGIGAFHFENVTWSDFEWFQKWNRENEYRLRLKSVFIQSESTFFYHSFHLAILAIVLRSFIHLFSLEANIIGQLNLECV